MSFTFSLSANDATLLAQGLTFKTPLDAEPTAYGLTAAQMTQFDTVYATFAADLAACAPLIRTRSAVIQKNASKKALKSAMYLLAQVVDASSATPAMKAAIGIFPRATPQRQPVPAMAPSAELVSVSNTSATLKFHDSSSDSRGLPPMVSGLSIFSYSGGPTAPTDIAAWKFEGNSGRSKVMIEFPASAAGTKVFVTAFYFNGSKQSGPASLPLGIVLSGGAISKAA